MGIHQFTPIQLLVKSSYNIGSFVSNQATFELLSDHIHLPIYIYIYRERERERERDRERMRIYISQLYFAIMLNCPPKYHNLPYEMISHNKSCYGWRLRWTHNEEINDYIGHCIGTKKLKIYDITLHHIIIIKILIAKKPLWRVGCMRSLCKIYITFTRLWYKESRAMDQFWCVNIIITYYFF